MLQADGGMLQLPRQAQWPPEGCPAAQAAPSLANAAPHPASLGQCSRTSSSKPASSSRSSGPVSAGLVVGWQLRFWMSGFPGGASGKDLTCQCKRWKRRGFNSGVTKIPWRRAGQPTPVFLPGESHGQRSLVGCSPWGRTESDRTACTHSKVWMLPARVGAGAPQ